MAGPRRIHIGQRLPGIRASDHNGFVDTYERVRALPIAGAGTGASSGVQALTVLVKNMTGADITSPFPILEIDGPVYNADDTADAVRQGISVKGITPTSGAAIADIVVCQGPIPINGLRSAVMLGPTWCEVDVTSESHTHAAPKSSDNTQLASGGEGAKIIWKQTGTGLKKALVMLGGGGTGGGIRLAKTQAGGIPARSSNTLGSGTIDMYDTSAAPAVSDTGNDETAYNAMQVGVAGNTFIYVAQDDQGFWHVIVEDC